MANYRKILKLLLTDLLRSRGKKQNGLYIFLAIAYVFFMIFSLIMLGIYAAIFAQGGKAVEFVTALLIADFAVTVFLGLSATISFLYLSKDNEFFLNLPVSPNSVFLAKLTMVYLAELVFAVAVLLPSLIVVGIVASLPWLFFLMIFPIILTVPLFAMIIISIISLPILYFITLFRNRGAITSIIVIVVFSAIMAVYFYFVFSAQSNIPSGEEVNYEPIFNLITQLAQIFYPFYMLVKFATLSPLGSLSLPQSLLVEISIFLLSAAAAAAISYLLTLMLYGKVNSKVLEKGATKAKKGSFIQASPFKAFFKKEFKEVLRDPTVALQALAGIVLCPLVVVMISVSMSSTFSSSEELASFVPAMFWGIGIMMFFSIGVGTNAGANFAISREGANFYYLKTLPVPYKTQVMAKQALYVLCGFCSTGLAIIALSVAAAINNVFVWWIAPLTLFAAYTWIYAFVSISIHMDLKNPRLDYKNIKEIMRRAKNSATSIIWMISSLVFSGIMLGLAAAFADYVYTILAIWVGIYAITGVIFAFLFHKKLFKNIDFNFERTE